MPERIMRELSQAPARAGSQQLARLDRCADERPARLDCSVGDLCHKSVNQSVMSVQSERNQSAHLRERLLPAIMVLLEPPAAGAAGARAHAHRGEARRGDGRDRPAQPERDPSSVRVS